MTEKEIKKTKEEKKERPIQELYDIDFVKVTRGTNKNLMKCIQLILDHFKEKHNKEYKVGFNKRFGWRHFPKWFSLHAEGESYECYFYKKKEGPQHLKVEMEQDIDEEDTSHKHNFNYLTIDNEL